MGDNYSINLFNNEMNKIFKYILPVQDKYSIELPIGSKIIRVDDVDGLFFLWAIVNSDDEAEKECRQLEFYKTGQPILTPLEDLHFIGSCKLFIMQELCLYVFENIKKL